MARFRRVAKGSPLSPMANQAHAGDRVRLAILRSRVGERPRGPDA